MPAKRRRPKEPLTLSSFTAAPSPVEERHEQEARSAVPQVEASADDAINVAAYLRHAASRQAEARALVSAQGRGGWSVTTFAELDAETDGVAAALGGLGLATGERLALLLPPGRELAVATFAAWKAGAVPVLVDSALSMESQRACLVQARPAALVGTARGLAARVLAFRTLPSVRFSVAAGTWLPAGLPFGAHPFGSLRKGRTEERELPATRALDPALVRFTSPARGAPRLVELDHRAVIAEVETARHALGLAEGEPALATSPAGAQLAIMLGMTAVVPDLDGPAPRDADAAHVLEALDAHVVTTAFGAPETWRRVAEACGRRNRTLPHLRRLVLAGGPVPPQLHEWLRSVMPAVETFALYGLAEGAPLAVVSGSEVLGETRTLTDRGGGLCLGKPARGVEASIVRVVDGPVSAWTAAAALPSGEVGEIVVRGPVLAPRHCAMEGRDPERDMDSGDGAPFHRTGDLGWVDRQGRLWHAGRADERLGTRFGPLFPECLEGILAAHPFARRVAVVGVGEGHAREPVLVVEGPGARGPKDDPERVRLQGELLALAQSQELTRRIGRVLFHPGPLPADAATASKVDRRGLAGWASVQLGGLGVTR